MAGTFLALLASAAGTAQAETLSLRDCLRETLEHSPLIVEKRLAIEQAAGTRLVFHATALPNLVISGLGGQQGSESAEKLRVPVQVAHGKNTSMTVTQARPATLFIIGSEALNQSIFDAAIPANWRRGNLEVESARLNLLVVATAQLHLARVEFYQALFQQENSAILQKTAASLGANTKGVSDLLNAGLGGRQSVLQAQLQQANFQPLILSDTGTLQAGITSLLQTMGRPLGAGTAAVESVKLGGPWEDGDLDFDAVAVARQTRERRPDLQALRSLVRAATEDANINRGGYYPLVHVYVTGDLLPENFVRSERQNSVRPGDNTRQTEIRPGARVEWNIIDTGTVRGSVREAGAMRDALAISLHQLEQNIPGELSQVRAQLSDAAKVRDLLQANVSISQDNLQMIRSGVSQGTNSQLEFLDAQNGALSTQGGLLAAQLQMSIAHAEYDRVTGGYLRFLAEDHPAADVAAPK